VVIRGAWWLSLHANFPELANSLLFTMSPFVFAGEFGASDRRTMSLKPPAPRFGRTLEFHE
jgi:hypothetical protein